MHTHRASSKMHLTRYNQSCNKFERALSSIRFYLHLSIAALKDCHFIFPLHYVHENILSERSPCTCPLPHGTRDRGCVRAEYTKPTSTRRPIFENPPRRRLRSLVIIRWCPNLAANKHQTSKLSENSLDADLKSGSGRAATEPRYRGSVRWAAESGVG